MKQYDPARTLTCRSSRRTSETACRPTSLPWHIGDPTSGSPALEECGFSLLRTMSGKPLQLIAPSLPFGCYSTPDAIHKRCSFSSQPFLCKLLVWSLLLSPSICRSGNVLLSLFLLFFLISFFSHPSIQLACRNQMSPHERWSAWESTSWAYRSRTIFNIDNIKGLRGLETNLPSPPPPTCSPVSPLPPPPRN